MNELNILISTYFIDIASFTMHDIDIARSREQVIQALDMASIYAHNRVYIAPACCMISSSYMVIYFICVQFLNVLVFLYHKKERVFKLQGVY